MVTYKVKMTIAAITSNESEVIAFQSNLFLPESRIQDWQKDGYDIRRLQRKSAWPASVDKAHTLASANACDLRRFAPARVLTKHTDAWRLCI